MVINVYRDLTPKSPH